MILVSKIPTTIIRKCIISISLLTLIPESSVQLWKIQVFVIQKHGALLIVTHKIQQKTVCTLKIKKTSFYR